MFFFNAVILFVILVVQTSVLMNFQVFGIKPELFFIFVVYLATRFDWDKGFWWGIAAGLLCSAVSIGSVKVIVFIYAVCALIAGSLRSFVYVDYLWSKVFVLFFMTFFETFLFVFFGVAKFSFSGLGVLGGYFANAFLNCVFAVPFYMLLEKFYSRVRL